MNGIIDLLNICLRSTSATMGGGGGDYYEQKEAAMGSPVSAVVANIYIHYFWRNPFCMRLVGLMDKN